MQRRDFLKFSATAGAVSCITACGGKSSETEMPPTTPPAAPEKVDYSTCTSNCYYNCVLKVHSRDGVVTRVETDGEGGDQAGMDQVRACFRGRASKQRAHAPERLKYPMKRVGLRGEGKFQRISWDEAFELAAAKITEIKEKYGNEALYVSQGSGTLMKSIKCSPKRLFNLIGGCLNWHSSYSGGQILAASKYMFGPNPFAPTLGNLHVSSSEQIQYSDLILSFGFNPNETAMSGGGDSYQWTKHASNAEFILVDPRYTDSALGKENQWVPIRPGTDAALAEAIAYYIITNNKHDQAFLNKYCVGFDELTLPKSAPKNGDYKSHILGMGEDKTPKTLDWAAKITGVPEHKILSICEKLVSAERPFICQGWGVQRSANGEQSARALFMLPLLLGAVGRKGTNTGGQPCFYYDKDGVSEPLGYYGSIPTGKNPITASIHCSRWVDAIEFPEKITRKAWGLEGAEKLQSGIKLIWATSTGFLNQNSNTNRTDRVLRDESKCEFILYHDVVMNASARYADLLLPGTLDIEEDDMTFSYGHSVRTAVACSTSIKPSFEAKSDWEVQAGVAKALGLENEFTQGKTFEDWMRAGWDGAKNSPFFGDARLPDYDEMRKKKLLKLELDNSVIGLKKFVDDPIANKLTTPSGKIEVYSESLVNTTKDWEFNPGERLSAIPTYVAPKEGAEDKEAQKTFPLQLVNFHPKKSVHSSFEHVPWVKEAVEDVLWMNPKDAGERNIRQGQEVLVESERGKLTKAVRVTPRIMPGVVAMGEGTWYRPVDGIDVGGCVNTLISSEPSPLAKNFRSNTVLVEVQPHN